MSEGWHRLDAELDAWATAGREAAFWWRDDDATAAGEAPTHLLDLAAAEGAPLALAVIPAAAADSLSELLNGHAAATTVLQHGFAHENHAAPPAKKCELVSPAARPAGIDELRRGREILTRRFGARFRPILVPPWNRLAEDLAPALPGLGFGGLSTYGARKAAEAAPGLTQVNCHLDLLRWRPTRGFLGTEAALALLTDHLAAKRRGETDPAEASGILSHHLVHDDASWDFLAQLLRRLAAHPAARLLSADEVFTPSPRQAGAQGAGR